MIGAMSIRKKREMQENRNLKKEHESAKKELESTKKELEWEKRRRIRLEGTLQNWGVPSHRW